jgi:DNA modification methylase
MNDTKLMLMDCFDGFFEIEENSIDMILVDPPYGNTSCKWDQIIPIERMWNNILRITKTIVIMASQPFASLLISSNLSMFKYEMIWKKNKVTGFLNAKKQPLRNHENILVFYKKQCKYYPQKTFGHKPVNKYTKKTSDGSTLGATKQGISGGGQTSRYPTTIKEFNVVNQDGTSDGGNFHPSQKPISLMEYLIKTYTDENDTVLDFAMGSGTTGVACKNTNRKFIGIEKNKDFFEIAKRRIMQ